MPIEIKEIEISVTVDSGSAQGAGQAQVADKKKLVAECVEKVMDIIKDQKER